MRNCEYCGKVVEKRRFCNEECVRKHKKTKAGIGILCDMAGEIREKEKLF